MRVLLTGTSRGLGRSLAERWVKAGNQVYGCSRGACDLDAAGYQHFTLDVADEKAIKAMFTSIRKAGGLDAVVHNVGISSANYVLLTPSAAVEAALRVNVLSSFLICREAVKALRRTSSGRVVLISSIHVPLATPGTALYGASKAAIEQLVRVLAKESSTLGTTINALSLSVVDGTGMADELGPEAEKALLSQTTLGRRLTLDEVAAPLEFLLTEASEAITGQILQLGGV